MWSPYICFCLNDTRNSIEDPYSELSLQMHSFTQMVVTSFSRVFFSYGERYELNSLRSLRLQHELNLHFFVLYTHVFIKWYFWELTIVPNFTVHSISVFNDHFLKFWKAVKCFVYFSVSMLDKWCKLWFVLNTILFLLQNNNKLERRK